ncbi:hypothetical protein ACFLWG_03460, partial [Chloroflexota bacterium]
MASLLLIGLPGASCAPARDFDGHLRSITKPYQFSIVQWEFRTLSDEAEQAIWVRGGKSDNEADTVTEYFSANERMKTLNSEIEAINAGNNEGKLASLEVELNRLQQQNMASAGTVERIIEKQIREVLSQQSIFNPLDKYIRFKIGFPPVNFKLEEPPHLLVISLRDRIENISRVLLRRDISLNDMESIEADVDELNVSSLVVGLGGLATFPSVIADSSDLRFTIDAAIEEWLHQYLAFKPLGFRYLLDIIGISRDYD